MRGAHSSYTGPRPRLQLWHGTEDDVPRYPNFGEEIKQRTQVRGIGQTGRHRRAAVRLDPHPLRRHG